jgi:carboxymethylenebutenolidase
MVNRLTAAGTSLNAGVAYYGQQLPAAEVPKITAPMMFHYGSLDTRIDAGSAAYEAALKANNKVFFESYMYEGANHAFNNNTNPSRCNKEAAELAWTRTVAFFRKHLGT